MEIKINKKEWLHKDEYRVRSPLKNLSQIFICKTLLNYPADCSVWKINAFLIIVFIFFSNLLFSGLLNNLNHDLIVIASLMLAVNLVLAIVLSLFKQAYIADSMSFRVSHLEIIFYYLILEVCFN